MARDLLEHYSDDTESSTKGRSCNTMSGNSSRTNNEAQVERFSDWQRYVRNNSPQTVLQYRTILDAWVEWLGRRSIRSASPEAVTEFMLRERGGRAHGTSGAPATRNKDRAVLSSFYEWLRQSDGAQKNPARMVGTAKVDSTDPRPLEDDVFGKLWAVAAPLERVWLGLGWYAGLRREEICNLQAHNFADGSIVAFKRKGAREPTFPLDEVVKVWERRLPHLWHGPEFLEPLLHLVSTQPAGEPLIPWERYRIAESARATARYGSGKLIEPSAMTRALERVCKRSGMGKHAITPHDLRHSFVTNMLRAGLPVHIVSSLAAHSDVKMTMRYMAGSRRMLAEWWSEQA